MRKVGFAFLGVIGCLLLLFLYVLWANRPVSYAKPAFHPPKNNAWDYYERALKMPSTPAYRDPGPGKTYSEDYHQPNPPENVRKMEVIHQGFGRPCVLPPVDVSDYLSIRGVSYASAREMARIFAREGNSLVRRREFGKAVDSYLDGMYLGADFSHGGMDRYLVATAMWAICGDYIDDPLIDRLTASECDRAIRRLIEIRRRCTSLGKVFLQEKLIQRQYWQSYTIQKPEDIREKLDPRKYTDLEVRGKKISSFDRLRVVLANKHRAAAEIDRYFDELAAESAKPYHQRKEPSVSPGFVAAAAMYLNKGLFADFSFIYTRQQALDRMLSIRVALRAYRLRKGSYPERLSPGLSKCLTRSDLEDPFDGKTFRYRRDGNGYILYSVWQDGKDDGGKPVKMGRKPGEKGDKVYRKK